MKTIGILALTLGAFGWWFLPRAWFRVSSNATPQVQISISPKSDARSVADLLAAQGIIDSSSGYVLYSFFDSSAQYPISGAYAVRRGMSYRTLARMFTIGPAREEIEIKIIEGWSIKDEQESLKGYGVDPKVFLNESKVDSLKFEFSFLQPLANGTTLEGYLFPDTYRVWKDQLPRSVIKKQLDAFASRAQRLIEDAKRQGRSLHDIVILASIIEKEVAKPEDRQIVAGIFWNRLRDGMPLQSDATIGYLTKSGRTRSTLDDLAIDSPFNTYRNKGLPPGPISNPGDGALDAALHPAITSYRYFLTDAKGKTYFAKTLEEHIRNRRRAFGQ